MPQLDDPDFAGSVIYICDHTEEGAMGLVVNQPLKISLNEVFASMGIQAGNIVHRYAQKPVYAGGPVQRERGFVLHRPMRKRWQSSVTLSSNLSVTTSRDILEHMARSKEEVESLITLGYAGWASGQLEAEVQDSAWLCCPADPEVLFTIPASHRWEAAANCLGIVLGQLACEPGHA